MVATRNLPGVRLLVRRWRPVPKPNHNPLAVAIERENASAILHLQGQLTVEQAGVLRRAFEEACRSEPVRLVVNLAACPFVDTAGVAALVAEAQRARQARRAFLLVGVRAQARSVLEMARLERVFDICATVEDALKDPQQQGGQS